MMRRRSLPLAVAATAVLAATAGTAADPVTRALATPVTATWTGLPLRTAVGRLAEVGGLAIVIDRRIDPDTLVGLDSADQPLGAVLARVAAEAGAETTVYAGHVRVVPRGHGAALAVAEQLRDAELRGLAPRFRAPMLAGGRSSWPDGAVPRDILTAAAAEAGIEIGGLDDLPHDHFPAVNLPPLPLAHRVDLVLAHFDRRIEWKPRVGRGAEAPVYRIVSIAGAAPGGKSLPEIAPAPAPARPGTAAATYSLTVAAPLEELLAALARRFSLTLDLDRAGLARVGVAPGEIVRLERRDASRDQLLDAILEPRGLAWRIEGDRLSVSAAPR